MSRSIANNSPILTTASAATGDGFLARISVNLRRKCALCRVRHKAHFRRKIFENHQTSPMPLTTALLDLYAIEAASFWLRTWE
ncbi:hypothetical protein [Novosphingobium sp. SG707]|uniref:hypothetical protein n=1 Tax=Novosphingobium sp. SG707 TaxID=2586996 RepID=UPI0014486A3D|nr:hypothetical protein [Novosphingobium sp. SG707]NKJ01612.1 hypothetical protein [Novosphingobium sp. SG707]